jgi:subtilisin
MRRPIAAMAAAATLLSAALAASSGTAMATPTSAQEPRGDSPASGAAAGSWIVVLAEHTAPNEVAAQHSRRYGAEVGHVYRAALKGYSARMSETAAARVAEDPRVLDVQPDRVVHITAPKGNGPKGNGPGGKGATPPPQVLPTGVDRVDADLSGTAAIATPEGGTVGTGDSESPAAELAVDVAVIDTGVDLDHPDLNVYTAGAKNCSTGRSADDGNGHGTHVAGTIAARDNTEGVVGVAPGARIWPVRVLNNAGSGTWSDVLCGIDYVTENAGAIEVANMSLGGPGSDDGACGDTNNDALHQAICASVGSGVTYVVAAGNAGEDAANSVPAAYGEVITVSALADFDGAPEGLSGSTCRPDEDDTFADFSNHGSAVDLIAPGVCIESTWKGGGYDTISGTSMASPHVAGGAALYIAGGGLTGVSTANRAATVRSALVNDGNLIWDAADGRDGIQEPLLDVRSY